MTSLTITITVTDDPNVSVATKATDMTEEQIMPTLLRAQQALQAEIDALDSCPYHQRAIPGFDLVCTTCDWLRGHSPDCPRKDEPWPRMRRDD